MFGCRLTFFGIKTKAPMILASSGAGIVPIPTMCEMDLLEKDTKPQGWWMRERILFWVQRYTTILSLCCGLVQPMRKPEGRSIPSLRELAVQIASHQRAWKNRAEVTAFGTIDQLALSISISPLGAWYLPDASQPSAMLALVRKV